MKKMFRKKKQKAVGDERREKPADDAAVTEPSSEPTPPEAPATLQGVAAIKDGLVQLLEGQRSRWFYKKYETHYEISPDAWWFYKAVSRLFSAVGHEVERISVSSGDAEEFYFSVLGLSDKNDWGEGENWSNEVNEHAVKEVRRFLEEHIPAEVVEKYRRRVAGREDVKVFLSYSSKDRVVVEKFGELLRSKGLSIWFDKHEIYIGDEIHSRISEGISQSQFFCVFLSRQSVASKWVQDELRQAIERVNNYEARVFPILLEDCETPGYLKGINYGDLRSSQGAAKLAEVVEHVASAIDRHLLRVRGGAAG